MNKTLAAGCLFSILTTSIGSRIIAGEVPDRDDPSEVRKVANFIDACIDEQLAAANITPASVSDDAEFLRRVYLDVAGKVPPVLEVRAFLSNSSPDKRHDLVNRLLDSPRFPIHFARRWRAVWLPPSNNNQLIAFQQTGFENWLRSELADDSSYSRIVAQMLGLPASGRLLRVGDGVSFDDATAPTAFFSTRQLNRDEIASAVARTMLGVRIECAQCHDHPFDVWRRDQFHSFAALFDGLTDLGRGISPQQPSVEKPVFLDGTPAASKSRNELLAEVTQWMISPENKYFARAAVNRIWQNFFGVGIVEPVDDFSDHNPPSHPRLLDGLSSEFIAHQFDLTFLVRSIVASRTYQRTSRNISVASDPRLFAHSRVRPLTAEQLWDNLEQLTSLSSQQPPDVFINNPQSPLLEFRRLFDAGAASAGDQSTTILQALALMNGQLVTEATTFGQGATLSAIVEYPGLTVEERIETLYLATLSRPPLPQEQSRSLSYVMPGTNSGLLSDVLWALLNTSEFVSNH